MCHDIKVYIYINPIINIWHVIIPYTFNLSVFCYFVFIAVDAVLLNDERSKTIYVFKSKILQTFNASKVPSCYCVGDRKLSLLHTRLRNKCSDLKFDLFTNHFKNSASCVCGHLVENAEYFFFHCAKYTNQRIKLCHDLQHIHPLNLNMLLFGSIEHTNEVNKHSCVCTQEFIKNSKRFDRTS